MHSQVGWLGGSVGQSVVRSFFLSPDDSANYVSAVCCNLQFLDKVGLVTIVLLLRRR